MHPDAIAPVTGGMTWIDRNIRSIDEFAFDFSTAHVNALHDVLVRTHRLERDEISLVDCGHPALDTDLSRVLDQIQHGRGLVLLRGFPVGGETAADVERMFWILCTHLGIALSQTSMGHRLVLVQAENPKPGEQSSRGSKANQELAMHTDFCEILAMLCVRDAKEGGESHLASSLAVHNELLAMQPELLRSLYEGFPYHRRGEQPDAHEPVTPYNVPVFSSTEGHVSSFFLRNHALAGMAEIGREPTTRELDALNKVREIAAQQQLTFRMAPGEAIIANNYTVYHSRSEFIDHDDPATKRLMVRMWLQAARDRRPVARDMMVYRNAHDRNGVDRVPGRNMARMSYHNVSERALSVLKATRDSQM